MIRLPVAVRNRNEDSTFDPGDTEMSREMEEVERTDRSRDCNEVEMILAGKENRDVSDNAILVADPEIGRT